MFGSYDITAGIRTQSYRPNTVTHRCSRGHVWEDHMPGGVHAPDGAIVVEHGDLRGLWCVRCLREFFGDRIGTVTIG